MILFYVSQAFANNNNDTNISFKLNLTYQDLQEKTEKIDTLCQFLSTSHKIKIMKKICSLDNETQITTNILNSFCHFKDNLQKINIIKRYCSFHTPRSKTKILENFCQLKTSRQKTQYIEYLYDITKLGEVVQRVINFNVEAERLIKRKDAFNTGVYNVSHEPHTEAAYQLGVIYGFSECGMRDIHKSVEFLQKAYDKPETFFMVAEFYRSLNQQGTEKRIYQFYNDAIKSGIRAASYNLALYIYEKLSQKTANDIIPTDFTYKNMMLYLQKATKYNDPKAQNDLAILMNMFYKNQNPKKLENIVNTYIAKAAEQNFMPAIYNQIVFILQKPCTNISKVLVNTNKALLKKNMIYLLQKNYQPAVGLLSAIKNNACYQDSLQKANIMDSHYTIPTALLEKQAFVEFKDTENLETMLRTVQ